MTPELRSGLLAGVLLAAALGGVLVLVLGASGTKRQFGAQPRPVQRTGRPEDGFRSPVPIGGFAVVVGTLVTLVGRQPVPGVLLVAIGGVGIIGAFDPRRLGAPASVALALPFTWLMSSDLDLESDGMRVFVVIVTALGAVAVARTEETWGQNAITPALLAITAGGIFLAVPDTEEAGALLGVALAMATIGWPLGLATLGRAGGGAVTVLVVWTAATGGRAAAPSIVAGAACLCLLVGLGLGRWLAETDVDLARSERELRSRVAAAVVHGGLVLFAARVGGAGAEMGVAVAVTVATLVVAVLAGVVLRPVPP